MKKFKLSEIQANHILDMPLRRLTRLARAELDEEKKELVARIKYLESLLKSPKKLRGVIKDELAEIRKKHADARRTQDRRRRGRARRRGPDRRGGRRHHGQPRRLREAPACRRVQAAGPRRQGREGRDAQGRGRDPQRLHHDDPPLAAVLHIEGQGLPGQGAPGAGRVATGARASTRRTCPACR